jgi:hypothetical protein
MAVLRGRCRIDNAIGAVAVAVAVAGVMKEKKWMQKSRKISRVVK